MIFKKPPNMRYTQLAMFVDAHIRDRDEKTQQLCFEYIWHLFYILAVKGKMFNSGRDYDEYALYAATQLYLRYKKEDNEKGANLKPIKSCLNYIKRILYPLKVNYQKANFEQVFQEGSLQGNAPTQILDDKISDIRNLNSSLVSVECNYYLSSIHSSIRGILEKTPYRNNKVILHNLYISCLLTFLKSITLSKRSLARLEDRKAKKLSLEGVLDGLYARESREDNIVLYHLDPSMHNYVAFLFNKIKKEVVKDLNYIIGSYEPSESVIKDLLMSPLEDILNKENVNE